MSHRGWAPRSPVEQPRRTGKKRWWPQEWGSICCSSVRSPTPSHTQPFQIKWEVYFSKNCVARLYCVVMILHADVYVLCVCIVGHGCDYTTQVIVCFSIFKIPCFGQQIQEVDIIKAHFQIIRRIKTKIAILWLNLFDQNPLPPSERYFDDGVIRLKKIDTNICINLIYTDVHTHTFSHPYIQI